MKYGLMVSAALLAGVAGLTPVQAQQGIDLVKQAVAAQGGAEALRALKTISIKAEGQHWEPGQSYTPGGEARFLGDSQIAITWDLANRAARSVWDRSMKYPAVETIKYTEVVRPDIGEVTNDKGSQPMSGIRVAAALRELDRASPTLLLRALDAPHSVSALKDQPFGEVTQPAVAITDRGTTFTVLFDRVTHLPVAVRTRDDDHIYGDSDYDLVMDDWRDVGGVKVAHALTYLLNGMGVQRLMYSEVAANPKIEPDAFSVGDQYKVASTSSTVSASSGAKDVPYQWVLRRLFLGRFLDSDKVVVPANGSLKLVELAPNVQQVVGGTANNLIVEMKDGLVVFDAPCCETQSRWVIEAAKEKYPGKPIKYLVLTHHHMDHTGGSRAYVAEGATVVVPDTAQGYFEHNLAAPHQLVADAQQKAAKPLHVVGVADEMSIKDESVEIRLRKIANPHVDGMLIAHVVQPNIVWVTDIWSPGRDAARTPNVAALNAAIKKLGIKGATFAGGHGSNAPQDKLDAIFAQN
jgi:glyoxylase-like metal-dependent hydrolase (beta-lactamase superfamily II)